MNFNELATKANLFEVQQRLLRDMADLKHLLMLMVSQGKGEPTNVLKAAYTTTELTEIFRKSNQTIHQWRNQGLLHGVQMNGKKSHWIYPYDLNKDMIDARLKTNTFDGH